MTRCLRIFGAYSYRLTRRHSTLLLIASIIITIVIILHLYRYKHHQPHHRPARIGDFDYQPGAFLRGQQPNENRSYCQFNYGLPDTLKWGSVHVMPTPEVGVKSPYRVIYNAIKGTMYSNYSKYNAVTYATQATPEYIYHIVEIARYWDGPISLSLFVPNYDLDITMQILNHLCHCYSGMSKVSVHLFYPKRFPPVIRNKEQQEATTEIPTTTSNITIEELLQRKLDNYRNLDSKSRYEYIQRVRKDKIERMMMRMPTKRTFATDLTFTDCSNVESRISTFKKDNNLIYHVNVGRNVARNASRTNYFIVSDIEMVPSDGLAPKFLSMVRKLMGDKKRDDGCVFAKTVFVVPLFEVERGEEIPRDKDT